MTPSEVRRHDSSTAGRCRILYSAGELHKGGLERQIYYLVRALDRERYQPAIAVWNYRDSDLHVSLFRALGVPIYSLSTASSRIGRLSRASPLGQEARARSDSFLHLLHKLCGGLGSFWQAQRSLSDRFAAISAVEKRGSGPLLGRLSARWPWVPNQQQLLGCRNCPDLAQRLRAQTMRRGV